MHNEIKKDILEGTLPKVFSTPAFKDKFCKPFLCFPSFTYNFTSSKCKFAYKLYTKKKEHSVSGKYVYLQPAVGLVHELL